MFADVREFIQLARTRLLNVPEEHADAALEIENALIAALDVIDGR